MGRCRLVDAAGAPRPSIVSMSRNYRETLRCALRIHSVVIFLAVLVASTNVVASLAENQIEDGLHALAAQRYQEAEELLASGLSLPTQSEVNPVGRYEAWVALGIAQAKLGKSFL